MNKLFYVIFGVILVSGLLFGFSDSNISNHKETTVESKSEGISFDEYAVEAALYREVSESYSDKDARYSIGTRVKDEDFYGNKILKINGKVYLYDKYGDFYDERKFTVVVNENGRVESCDLL